MTIDLETLRRITEYIIQMREDAGFEPFDYAEFERVVPAEQIEGSGHGEL